ncbi:MmgE/PrpD family protein [Candidatus Formimonas warabiya]|uniref:MmgE/PrpD family protein n=1 Tax=Formimonas warabiya TaxID=1761012 RepID=A0A3G1KY48_FORW1|nr:MmgE/PrpD family protein [Candidatus Formimonas warabiya]ATW27396.1 hypothetical protein DCMF_23945 [Candidatus Formimonas warabiya]
MNDTHVLSSYVAGLRWEDIPEEVISRSKINILDTLGVAVRGSLTNHAKAAFQTISELDGPDQASVIGQERGLNVTQAAFLNALSAHAIDFDDAHKFVHPGCVVIPSALCLAEKLNRSGKSFILAVIAGYDISVRVSQAAGVEHRKRGFHPTGTCNFLGAAAAAARALGLEASQVEAAFGIAGTQAAGLTQYRFDGSADKHFHAGMAAQGGVLSALLAQSGFQGTKEILEGKFGFLNVLGNGGSPEKLVQGLGEVFPISETDIKPYPSCRQTHTVVDLALQAAQKNMAEGDIKEILVEIYDYATESWLVDTSPPESGLQGMLNIPYCLASALVYGKLSLEHFQPEMLREPVVHRLARKVKVVPNSDFSRKFPEKKCARLQIKLVQGADLCLMAENPRGSADAPFTFGDVEEKFHQLADQVIGQSNTDEIVKQVKELEAVGDMAAVARLLRKDRKTCHNG